VEISHRPGKIPQEKKALFAVLSGLKRSLIVNPDETPEIVSVLSIPFAYVIYDKFRKPALDIIHSFLRSQGIYSIGRYGAWEYSFMERSVIEGMETAALLEEEGTY
jgi:hypothetical protein